MIEQDNNQDGCMFEILLCLDPCTKKMMCQGWPLSQTTAGKRWCELWT